MLRDSLDFLRDIEESCIRIADYTAGLSRDEVFTDKMRFDGILHNFHIIGEAVKKLPDDLRQTHTDIPWSEIAGMRDLSPTSTSPSIWTFFGKAFGRMYPFC
jgi:uncharacterized protein with HEPN domain